MHQNSFKAALIQLHSIPYELDQNFKNAETRIRAAAADGATLAVLPEYHLSGWAPEDIRFLDLASRAEEFIQKYCALAAELGICIVPGTIIAYSKWAQDGFVNIALFIDDCGNILNTYMKKNLWHPERAHLTAGLSEPHVAFDSPIGRVGLLVCWDLAFPEAFRELVVQGAEVIIIPAFWMGSEQKDCDKALYSAKSEMTFLDSMLISRAFENTCCIIFCNTGGKCDDFMGISQITIPLMGSLARLPTGTEATLLADVDLNVVKAAEVSYKIRADLAKSDWHYRYQGQTIQNMARMFGGLATPPGT